MGKLNVDVRREPKPREIFTPSINYKSNTIPYDKIPSDPGISITNPATGTDVTLQSLYPDDSQRTLGVILSLDGKGKLQL